jgi:WD40-like Beta Propeller Repeat
MNKFFLLFSFFAFGLSCFAQTDYKKYIRTVCNNSENEIAPSLSMDGNTLIYSRKRAMDDGWKTQITRKVYGQWERPIDFVELNELPQLRFLGSYCLNKNGTEALYVTKKSGGIGAYDIWSVKYNGSTWSKPENLGKPLNSTLDEINPCFNIEGNGIYFTQKHADKENGKIYFSILKGSFWSQPKEIVLGDDFFSVKIAADNETMYLTKIVDGKTHLFISKLSLGKWGVPVRITDYDPNSDHFITLDCQSVFLTASFKKDESYDLYLTNLPEKSRSMAISNLSYESKEYTKIEIKKTNAGEVVYRGTELNEYYLKNNDEYTLSFMYKDHYPFVSEVNLVQASSAQKTFSTIVNPNNKGRQFILADFDTIAELNHKYLKNYGLALKQMLDANPDKKFEIVHYQKLDSIVFTDSLDSVHIDTKISEKIAEDNLNKIQQIIDLKTTNLSYKVSFIRPKELLKKEGIYIEQK